MSWVPLITLPYWWCPLSTWTIRNGALYLGEESCSSDSPPSQQGECEKKVLMSKSKFTWIYNNTKSNKKMEWGRSGDEGEYNHIYKDCRTYQVKHGWIIFVKSFRKWIFKIETFPAKNNKLKKELSHLSGDKSYEKVSYRKSSPIQLRLKLFSFFLMSG